MLARIAVIIILPPIVVWAIAARLGRELRSAVKYAYWDACAEIDSARVYWRARSCRPRGEDDQ